MVPSAPIAGEDLHLLERTNPSNILMIFDVSHRVGTIESVQYATGVDLGYLRLNGDFL